MIHADTNNLGIDSQQVIFDKLLSLKKKIQSVVPKCNVIISNVIKRTDNRQANSVNEKVNQLLKNPKLHVINDTHREKAPSSKTQLLQKVGISAFGSLLHQINSL